MLKGFLALLLISTLSFAYAKENIIAIVDSGVDYLHADLVDKMWENPDEIKGNRRDDDDNGKRDDYYGWNFAEDNGEVISLKDDYLVEFSRAPFRMYKIQEGFFKKGMNTRPFIGCYCNATNPDESFLKKMSQIASDLTKGFRQKCEDFPDRAERKVNCIPEDPCKDFDLEKAKKEVPVAIAEVDWLCRERKKGRFKATMSTFGNYVHGTHVAGIASSIADKSKIMAIKLLPTEQKLRPRGLNKAHTLYYNRAELPSLVKKELKKLAKGMESVKMGGPQKGGKGNTTSGLVDQAVEEIAQGVVISGLDAFKYAHEKGASVVNGSFGIPEFALRRMANIIFRISNWGRVPTFAQSDVILKKIGDRMLEVAGKELKEMESTLFVFAAGNEGLDNDELPSYPANLSRLPNVMSVAATVDYEGIASFSNFGKETVNVAAPGVVIKSAYPDYEHQNKIEVSGTSQAAPYVAGVAGKMMSLNPALKPADVKKIIMKSIDQKDFLKDKVAAEGVVNDAKAFLISNRAAKVGVKMALESSLEGVANKTSRPWVQKLAKTGIPKFDVMPGFNIIEDDEEQMESDIEEIFDQKKKEAKK